MIDSEEYAAWFRLLDTPELGRSSARELLAAFGSPQAVFSAPTTVLREKLGARLAAALAQPSPQYEARLAAARAWLDAGQELGAVPRHVITLGEPAYPAALLNTADPPLLLYAQGELRHLMRPMVAVVGSRHATPQGLDIARQFARALAQAGVGVVSGLALGIDGAAHEGALDVAHLTAAGGTVAVVATGLDRVYPPRHHALAHRIAEQGLLLSEYAPGVPALAQHFPQRNRIIAGLALGTLVVEAALRSGSLITARLAAEAGREVYAVPGSLRAEQSRGCHALIRDGAMLVESAQDILDDLQPKLQRSHAPPPVPGAAAAAPSPASPAAEPDDPLLRALGADPMTLDELSARTGWGVPELSARLLELEFAGELASLPGGRVQRRFRG